MCCLVIYVTVSLLRRLLLGNCFCKKWQFPDWKSFLFIATEKSKKFFSLSSSCVKLTEYQKKLLIHRMHVPFFNNPDWRFFRFSATILKKIKKTLIKIVTKYNPTLFYEQGILIFYIINVLSHLILVSISQFSFMSLCFFRRKRAWE